MPLLLSDDSSGAEKGRQGDRVYYYVFDKELNATKIQFSNYLSVIMQR